MEVFANKLKELRRNKAVTQKVVAQNISISERQYIDLENNKAKPTVDTLIALADYYNISLDYLTSRTDNPDSHKS
jgi:transcriptional regulator with XRE-family HTH domain